MSFAAIGLAIRGWRIARNTMAAGMAARSNCEATRLPSKMTFRCLFTLLAVVLAAPAFAAPKTAVFPFDLHDTSQDGELVPVLNPEDVRRLKVVADELKSLMTKDGRFEVVDLTPLAAEIDKASPFNQCDGCEVPIAAKAGADLVVTGFVDKFSDSLISLQLFVRDVKKSELKQSMSVAIIGNTDELWLHGLSWLWRNKLKPQDPPK